MKSKKDQVLKLFFEEPSKQWHFKDLKKEVKIADNKLSNWLKKFEESNLIKKMRPQKQHPHYKSNHESAEYKSTKKLYAQKKLYESGLIKKLINSKANTIIIFGSLSRSDWHKDSDIDIFIYGEHNNLNLSEFENILSKEISIFSYKSREQLSKIDKKLLKNIIQGNLVKGNLDFLEVNIC